MESNTAFQTMRHNFRILQFTEMGLHLSESLISCASVICTTFRFAINGKERREPCTANSKLQGEKPCFFRMFCGVSLWNGLLS